MKTEAIVFTGPGKVEVKSYDLPQPASNQVITKTIYTGVSTGTETRVLSGRQHGAVFPLIPGYENVGEIIETGKKVKLKKGQKVFIRSTENTGPFQNCWGGQVGYALVSENECFPLPKNADLLSCVFAHTAAIAYHGVKRAKVSSKDKVVIVGQGLIGFLASLCCKAFGAKVIAVDLDENRLEAAKNAGIDFIINPSKTDVEKTVKELTNGGADVAFDVTGIASTVDKTGQLVHGKPWKPPYPPSARIVLLASYTEPVAFSYFPTLFDNEPDIFPSRDCIPQDIADVLKLILSKKLNPLLIPYKIFSYKESPAGYNELLNKKTNRVIFDWTK